MRCGNATWVQPIFKPRSLIGATSATFLNRTHEIVRANIWNDPAREKLWLYNLHYFDDFSSGNSHDHSQVQEKFLLRWITENPPASGNGWEPYPISLRIVNWIKWAQAGNVLPDIARESLAVQIRWLTKRIENHLRANHLFVNAKALVYAGLAHESAESDQWLKQGLAILSREIPEQILADGAHFERSPMYHAIILEDILDLINASGAWPGRVPNSTVELWRTTAYAMMKWLDTLSHPDGNISFFNDAAFEIAPTRQHIAEFAHRLGITHSAAASTRLQCCQPSGYVRAECGDAVLIADIAPIGPDYQPGHAHADSLSFELSLHGQRVVVNSGTSTYVTGPQRSYERSTAAHNTLEINGCDSSEVWGGFRVARRARIIESSCTESEGLISIIGAHDGYRRLTGRPIHRRRWDLSPHSLKITDMVEGQFDSALARFYLHPDATKVDDATIRLPTGELLSFKVQGGSASIEPASWYSQFGTATENLCVVAAMKDKTMVIELTWN